MACWFLIRFKFCNEIPWLKLSQWYRRRGGKFKRLTDRQQAMRKVHWTFSSGELEKKSLQMHCGHNEVNIHALVWF
jgi:hypothetical protein